MSERARHARRRQQRGGRHAEERHEGGVARAEVHVGQVEEARRRARIARTSGLAAVAAREDLGLAEAQRARAAARRRSPGCSAPGRSRRPGASGTAAPPTPATSSAMKCGTSHITGRSLRSAKLHVALDVDQPLQALRRAHTRAGRARARLRPSQRKCSRASARALGRRQLREAQLEVAQRDCAGASRPAHAAARPSAAAERRLHAQRQPVQQPQQRRAASVRADVHRVAGARRRRPPRAAACSGGSPTGTAAGTARISRSIARLMAAAAACSRIAAGERLVERRDVHDVAGAARQPLGPHQQQRRAGLLRPGARPASWCRPAAEERRPHAHAVGRHLVGQQADRLAAPQRADHLAHAGQRGRRGGQAGPRARGRPSARAARPCAPAGTARSSAGSRRSARHRPARVTSKQPRCGVRKTTPRPCGQRRVDQLVALPAHRRRDRLRRGRSHSNGSSTTMRPACGDRPARCAGADAGLRARSRASGAGRSATAHRPASRAPRRARAAAQRPARQPAQQRRASHRIMRASPSYELLAGRCRIDRVRPTCRAKLNKFR